ncbi:hypothetical protein EZ313_07435 [Ramlibacter henchirensis]|uniref:Uncharacterized protein n=1 Tax=Ramlibacter henchirensis TaxID=204072 RepID=A0A4Z0C8P8_9BURK|nr:hypothetical protein [Ramlibacter henchirensis]TFZ06459.1 hypothetical protein EZ313_07435 [Ramlibacter henchirensis]
MNDERPPLHVVAFYCCVFLIDVGSLRLGRFLDRNAARFDRLLASVRRRFLPARAAAARGGLNAGLVRHR